MWIQVCYLTYYSCNTVDHFSPSFLSPKNGHFNSFKSLVLLKDEFLVVWDDFRIIFLFKLEYFYTYSKSFFLNFSPGTALLTGQSPSSMAAWLTGWIRHRTGSVPSKSAISVHRQILRAHFRSYAGSSPLTVISIVKVFNPLKKWVLGGLRWLQNNIFV